MPRFFTVSPLLADWSSPRSKESEGPETRRISGCTIELHFDIPYVPKIGTIVPNMGTRTGALSNILFSGSRRSILALLYGHADEQFYLREIARRAGTGIGATQRELRQLTEAGLIQDVRRGRQVYYQANRKNPIFVELKSILAKTSGMRDILHEALTSFKDRIKLAFVYGSIARGEEKASSDVDLMVVGEISFSDVVSTLAKIETKLGREVNPTVYGPREFRAKLAAKNHFLSAVAEEKKLFVIGDEREFRRLGQERLARRA
jgi:predicted nucleotidyltransferase